MTPEEIQPDHSGEIQIPIPADVDVEAILRGRTVAEFIADGIESFAKRGHA